MSTNLPPIDLGNELWTKRRERKNADEMMKSLENRV